MPKIGRQTRLPVLQQDLDDVVAAPEPSNAQRHETCWWSASISADTAQETGQLITVSVGAVDVNAGFDELFHQLQI